MNDKNDASDQLLPSSVTDVDRTFYHTTTESDVVPRQSVFLYVIAIPFSYLASLHFSVTFVVVIPR